MLPARQQPVYLIAIPVLRNDCLKAIFLQMDSLLSRDCLGNSSINYHIHELFYNLKASLWECIRVFRMLVIAFGNNMRNTKSIFVVFVTLSWIAIF